MASDAAVSRKLCGVIPRPSAFTVLLDHQWSHPVATAVDVTPLNRYYERFARPRRRNRTTSGNQITERVLSPNFVGQRLVASPSVFSPCTHGYAPTATRKAPSPHRF